ncbi:MAG: rod shape-determining protein [Clostridia bacterium]|nr:rod shape-determining protein [Clostridia bacterium]
MRQNVAVDLGSSGIRIALEKKGVLIDEPSLVAVRPGGEVVAIGGKARILEGKTGEEEVNIIRPVKKGTISDYTVTVNMVGYFLDEAIRNPVRRLIKPDVITPVHCDITNVGRRATERALREAGAGRIFFVESPLAAAVGANLDVSAPNGKMVVSIGADITDIAVISYDGIVAATSVNVGGRSFDEAVKTYFRREYNMVLGDRTAEKIKNENVCVYRDVRVQPFDVSAFELSGRLPQDKQVRPEEMVKQLSDVALPIVEGISKVLEKTPPELVSDIYQRGIVLTGGGARLAGLDIFISKGTGIDTVLADDPQYCVVNGCMKILNSLSNEKKNELMND